MRRVARQFALQETMHRPSAPMCWLWHNPHQSSVSDGSGVDIGTENRMTPLPIRSHPNDIRCAFNQPLYRSRRHRSRLPFSMIPLSVLDLSPIPVGSTASDSLRNTLDFAQRAERWGYRRFWLAEHHNMPGNASAATSVVIGHVARGTSTIRVGSGGIMLPNHAPLVIAEQFGTLASLFPGRIDLGLGRAPGTDQATAYALRRDLHGSADSFPDDVIELQRYFSEPVSGQSVQAVPGAGLNVPMWLLGSSLFSAKLAAVLGLPFAFAAHFAPDQLMSALQLYRAHFRPSAALARPYTMVGLNLFAADSQEEAQRLFTTLLQHFVWLGRGTPRQLHPPVERIEGSAFEVASASRTLAFSVIGDPKTVHDKLHVIAEQTGADELILTAQIYDHTARMRSFEIAAQWNEKSAEKSG
jgi:luciferase family oxidoreductase group 1